MSAITPFVINISDDAISDLKARLTQARFPDAEPTPDWSQGIPLAYVREIRDYWLNGYDWRTREAALNRFDGFKTTIEGLGIHFLHVRSSNERARPLIMTHGWPGSIVEFMKVIEPLAEPQNHGGNASDAFHVVCPSLPGFGFSDQPEATGWNIGRIATAWDTLMERLGYDKYYAQGGDWGSVITTAIGAQNRGRCQGIHVTMPVVAPDPATMDDLTELEQSAIAAAEFYQTHDSGYSKQQGTRPQTLGYGLADSPVGQAAWIIEKFYQWMDCNGHPENVVTRDELLDNVMLYWLTNTGASSARIYWENARSRSDPGQVPVPAGCSIFPKEIFKASRRWAQQRFTDLRHFNVLDEGGHFAAFETPDVFVREVRDCFRLMD